MDLDLKTGRIFYLWNLVEAYASLPTGCSWGTWSLYRSGFHFRRYGNFYILCYSLYPLRLNWFLDIRLCPLAVHKAKNCRSGIIGFPNRVGSGGKPLPLTPPDM